MDKKITIGNVCFIKHTESKKLLLLKRNREPMANMYTGVGEKTHFEEDIHASCCREVREETGLEVSEVELRGIVKTILEGTSSSWILFVYTAVSLTQHLIDCPEGELEWVDIEEVHSKPLIGFIREILPHVLNRASFFEGTIHHTLQGEVVKKKIRLTPFADHLILHCMDAQL